MNTPTSPTHQARGLQIPRPTTAPVLAIAGYHRRDDLWRIPAWISSLDLDYRLRFRIHAHNSFDAVFYAY